MSIAQRPPRAPGAALMAAGRLPFRADLHPDEAAPEAWRALTASGPEPLAVRRAGFAGPDGGLLPHAPGLRGLWDRLQAGLAPQAHRPLGLIYLHRGHQFDTASPVLADLLRLIGHRGAAWALRAETPAALADALDLARQIATLRGPLLVLSDPTRRLPDPARPCPALRFLLLGLPEDHRPAARLPSPSRSLVQETA
ncbi:hypothetical protein KM176_20340 [Pseudooceanicola sp. CBS1P-1]|uniref:Uncharacterized protein n=1 Tax=Pseudooceanicola albus TaxID=2692189 RepID=A0A6L7G874_9RHOB|nr:MULTISPECIES: hypothetical protein [Pseudooceanicola]MBT9386231.1 hypothetical protein [Pseudooceanicola endophyticus]MXN20281.1 hypothetical protein [Pseudooceanicola albus]